MPHVHLRRNKRVWASTTMTSLEMSSLSFYFVGYYFMQAHEMINTRFHFKEGKKTSKTTPMLNKIKKKNHSLISCL